MKDGENCIINRLLSHRDPPPSMMGFSTSFGHCVSVCLRMCVCLCDTEFVFVLKQNGVAGWVKQSNGQGSASKRSGAFKFKINCQGRREN